MSRIISFTTYPTKLPLHGGQRRINAFSDFYRDAGIDYESVCVYEPAHYTVDQVGPHDVPLKPFQSELHGVPFVNDLASGLFAAVQARVRKHFQNLILARKPQAIVLEQPFMWPLIAALRNHPQIERLPII